VLNVHDVTGMNVLDNELAVVYGDIGVSGAPGGPVKTDSAARK